MGVNLSSLVPKKEISFEELSNKKIAVDASQMLYQFLSSIRQPDGTSLSDSKGRTTSHLVGLSTRIPNLISRGLKLCFVFDGTPPEMKQEELALRTQRKQEARAKLAKAREEEDYEAVSRYTKQSISVYKEMTEEAKQLILSFGLPVIQAPSEAEAQAAFLAKNHDVDIVASSDYDALLYHAPLMVRNLTLASRRRLPSGMYISVTPELISLQETLTSLGITHDKLLLLSIMVGTDFNPKGVKGIGPKTALKLVKEATNPDAMFKSLNPDFDWKKIYTLFKNMPVEKNYRLSWNQPEPEKIKNILLEHDFNPERVDKLISSLETTSKQKSQSNLGNWF